MANATIVQIKQNVTQLTQKAETLEATGNELNLKVAELDTTTKALEKKIRDKKNAGRIGKALTEPDGTLKFDKLEIHYVFNGKRIAKTNTTGGLELLPGAADSIYKAKIQEDALILMTEGQTNCIMSYVCVSSEEGTDDFAEYIAEQKSVISGLAINIAEDGLDGATTTNVVKTGFEYRYESHTEDGMTETKRFEKTVKFVTAVSEGGNLATQEDLDGIGSAITEAANKSVQVNTSIRDDITKIEQIKTTLGNI